MSCDFLIFRNYFSFFHQYNFVVKICRFISAEWFSKFPLTFRRWALWDMLLEVLIVLIFLLRLTTKFFQFLYNFNISGLFEIFLIKGFCFPWITFVLRGTCLSIFFRKIFSNSETLFSFCVVFQHLLKMNLLQIAYSFYIATYFVAF